MKITLGEKRRWAFAAFSGSLLLTGILGLFRVPSTPPSSGAGRTQAPVQIARPSRVDPILQEETELRDLTPLFLPTERNASLPQPRREPGRTLLDEENPKYRFSDAELTLSKGLPPAATLSGKPAGAAEPVDVFAPQILGGSLAGFGRQQIEEGTFKSRGGFLEVVAAGTGRVVLAEALLGIGRPPGDKVWSPVEYLAVVDASGLAIPLIVTEGSRLAEVDAFLGNYLTRNYQLGGRLPPGFYRVTVAP
ncbi:MAG: hypothetical protein WCQ89_12230 [Verrucomicrobiota bacterium]